MPQPHKCCLLRGLGCSSLVAVLKKTKGKRLDSGLPPPSIILPLFRDRGEAGELIKGGRKNPQSSGRPTGGNSGGERS